MLLRKHVEALGFDGEDFVKSGQGALYAVGATQTTVNYNPVLKDALPGFQSVGSAQNSGRDGNGVG